jgi:predicted PurR-regulated permease PerM
MRIMSLGSPIAHDVSVTAAPHAREEFLRLDRDELTATLVELAIRVAALALLLYWALALIRPFASIVMWSVVIAVALHPAFRWLAARLGNRRRLAAGLITVLGLLIVIGPATWLVIGLIDSARIVAEKLGGAPLTLPPPFPALKSWPLVGDQLYDFWMLASTNLKAAAAKIAPQLKPLGASLLHTVAGTGTATVKFLLAIVVAGFLLPPAPTLVAVTKQAARRLISTRGDEFVDLAGATIRTVARGVIGISALQALLAGLGLLVAGVPGATLITSAALVLGIIQIGASVVLVPVVIWAWFDMPTTSALLFTAYMMPVALLDNVLRPMLMGRGLRVPMLVILVGVIGGTLAYGITGLFLGPIVLSVMWELAAAWVAARDEGEAGAADDPGDLFARGERQTLSR